MSQPSNSTALRSPPSEGGDLRGLPPSDPDVLLDIRDLRTYFYTLDGVVKAVDGVDFTVRRGEVVGLVGESGCGKSVTSLSVMRLIAHPGRIESGEIWFDNVNLLDLPIRQMTDIRGNRISMIFQQPTSCLNPVYNTAYQLSEVYRIHDRVSQKVGRKKALELLKQVGISDPERRLKSFPHELSGGMAQRVMIGMAIACVPQLLIADEPTTALDVTIQAQILDLMRDLQARLGTAIILITHDLGVVAEMASRVAVMYAGQIVEEADIHTLFHSPKHPYTVGLIGSVPVLGQIKDELYTIPGNVPSCIDLPEGCRFAPRCRARLDRDLTICLEKNRELKEIAPGHKVRCWLY
ncbi:MAG: ABC transporter ATP-binding protein [Anaerolineae bacterium]|nr:ABC transporter ATP-binding protein [Anaerolineae bacterium]